MEHCKIGMNSYSFKKLVCLHCDDGYYISIILNDDSIQAGTCVKSGKENNWVSSL